MGSFTQCAIDTAIIQALSDLPNDTDGLTASQLKAKFDEAITNMKTYLNSTLIAELEATGGADKVGVVSAYGSYLQDFIDTVESAGSGSIPPNGTVSNDSLATDVKVGSLASLTSTEKASVVGAINEVISNLSTTDGNIATNVSDISTNASNLTTHEGDSTLHTDILTTRGDVILQGASGRERLALGTSGQVLQSDGTDVVWGSNLQTEIVTGDDTTTSVPSGTYNKDISCSFTPKFAIVRIYNVNNKIDYGIVVSGSSASMWGWDSTDVKPGTSGAHYENTGSPAWIDFNGFSIVGDNLRLAFQNNLGSPLTLVVRWSILFVG